ncbi:MAG: hypothetical protein A2509_12000 [Candidatus Edwardsbacteria bacterium RIFOXYD12_FULL_50_11]|uniref:PorV/PorQ family protein n=1 Tax=Candidatus Edwardsbacteria bacterium GWF2_54_11 TaxID=1817851 RepID=A0A1F5QYA2_9BACT|nr:MAG: hypothetical protein A2502_04060 [Candidatus Edwardsbacteria bacterium RifOxyC12_full_54_24]OGF07202.1 MAG: hypothetical protein A2024_09805 [Candidatus Edwardsbacteria bacterium GWF2_54_11]OGF08573.1 MAG: hypothetical protein A2273_06440 [Candidatus Edwardsbacteria bacterium RifOxyA12_full_54_48]OGF11363.1 MAG: hypothetical protein A3K15_03305 [Candidatus Edwardsbacteria bacterium GWE2_54_12]OGF16840.1 MAG: hypothetical protein A2509_12000 [Candidatus Edwardsbacteria bacterium RIFOXYD1
MKRFIIILGAVVLAQTVQAQLLYWGLPTTAEQVAFGQGCLLQSREPQGLMHNPSSLGFIKYRTLAASGIQWWQEVYGGSASAVLPVRGYGTASLGLGYWSLGTMAGYSEDGRPMGTVQSQATNLGLGYGLVLDDAWGLGLALKSSRLNLPDRYDWGWSSDIALSYKRGLITGSLMVKDLGPDYPKNNEINYPLNTVYLAGAGAAYFEGKVSGSVQYNIRKEEGGYPSLSLEVAPLSGLDLKIGYEKVPELADRSPLGFGIEIDKLGRRDLSVTYGYRSYGDLGHIQALTMGISF